MRPDYRKLEKLMIERDMSQADVARDADIDPSLLTRWKNGDYYPKTDKLYKLAKLFGVTIEDLLTGGDADDSTI